MIDLIGLNGMTRNVTASLCVLQAVLAGLLTGCSKPLPPKEETPVAPVTVATSTKKTVPIQVRTIGTVKTLSTVGIRPRVSGQITEIDFVEGDFVKKGQKLMVIDPRPYEVAVKSAEAMLAKSIELQIGAERDLQRLEKIGIASGIELDTARTAAASAKASVAIERAALESAKLQLSFTTITAPMDGRVGELLVNLGNLVDAYGPNPLVVINQISPIQVAFSLPEQHLPTVSALRRDAATSAMKVEAFLRNGEPPVEGRLAFIDNTVNAASGTIMLKAEFSNTDGRLWPGQFVDIVLTVRERPESIVVPMTAIQTGQKGTYVFVVTPDNTVELRPVAVAFEHQNEAIIASGLSDGETVVTEGQLRLVAGSKIEVKSSEVKSSEVKSSEAKSTAIPEKSE